jgi:hypothetical protein
VRLGGCEYYILVLVLFQYNTLRAHYNVQKYTFSA